MISLSSGQGLVLTVVPLVSEATPRVSGGGLNNNYIFAEAQFHWGDLTDGGPSLSSKLVLF